MCVCTILCKRYFVSIHINAKKPGSTISKIPFFRSLLAMNYHVFSSALFSISLPGSFKCLYLTLFHLPY